MKRQKHPERVCGLPERSCKVVKKHSCLEHTTNRSNTNNTSKDTPKKFCPCNPCSCEDCPDILKLLNTPISKPGTGLKSKGFDPFDSSNYGLCPKASDAKPASCSKNCTEVVRPKPIELDVIIHEDECTCELIARAIRADVHRYLNIVDRTHDIPTISDPKSCPRSIAKSVPKSNLKSNIKFSEPDSNSNPPNPNSLNTSGTCSCQCKGQNPIN